MMKPWVFENELAMLILDEKWHLVIENDLSSCHLYRIEKGLVPERYQETFEEISEALDVWNIIKGREG